ncbi:MAG: metallophosphoesterase [Prevotella sp.]|nr:metallophosphoesterase [Prevotella sp.]
MKAMWMLLFMGLPLLAIGYIGWHLWCLLPLSAIWKTVVIIVMAGCFLLTFANFSRSTDGMPMPVAITCYEVANSSLIILLYLFMLFLVLDLGRLVRLLPRTILYNNWGTTIGIVVLMTAIFTYGYFHYKHKYREDIRLTTEKSMAKPIKLVMMSDLHLGYHNRREELRRWVDMMNEEHADAILIAGDIIDMSIRPLKEEKMYEEFKRLNAPVYACLGNHEYYSGEPDAQKFYEQAGIHLLRDSCAVVDDLCVIGRDDRTNQHRKTLADIMKQADRSKFTILLDHQPYHLEQAERQKIDFQFSGHTHHGQVWPISWITENIYECAFGAHQRSGTRYYVSSGIGIWGGKFRIGTRSEYIVATISHQ